MSNLKGTFQKFLNYRHLKDSLTPANIALKTAHPSLELV